MYLCMRKKFTNLAGTIALFLLLFLCAILTLTCLIGVALYGPHNISYRIVLFFLLLSLLSNLVARALLIYLKLFHSHA